MANHPRDEVMARVTHLRTTPIKGFTIRESPRVLLTVGSGVAGDRAFFLLDEADRLMSATRTPCFLPYWAAFDPESDVLAIGRGDETLLQQQVVTKGEARGHFFGDRYADGRIVEGPWNDFLSEVAGERLRLVRATSPLGGFDLAPVSLVSQASVRALTPGDHEALDSRRFRMTVTLEGVAAFAEDAWVGASLAIGDCVVRVTSTVRRCAAVQKDPDGRAGRQDPLRRIKEVRGTTTTVAGRGLHLGVYAEVEESGYVHVGDSVRLLA